MFDVGWEVIGMYVLIGIVLFVPIYDIWGNVALLCRAIGNVRRAWREKPEKIWFWHKVRTVFAFCGTLMLVAATCYFVVVASAQLWVMGDGLIAGPVLTIVIGAAFVDFMLQELHRRLNADASELTAATEETRSMKKGESDVR